MGSVAGGSKPKQMAHLSVRQLINNKQQKFYGVGGETENGKLSKASSRSKRSLDDRRKSRRGQETLRSRMSIARKSEEMCDDGREERYKDHVWR